MHVAKELHLSQSELEDEGVETAIWELLPM